MNRAKIQDYIDQREEQRSEIYHIEALDSTHFNLNKHPYELVKDYRQGFNAEEFANRFSSILSKYDYIVGDWGYEQLRLKGFYLPDNPQYEVDKDVRTIEDYLLEYCNFGCAYFIVRNNDVQLPRHGRKRIRRSHKKTPVIHERRRKIRQPSPKHRQNQTAERVKKGNHQKFIIHQRKRS